MSAQMILILGVTASGKGKVAFELARRLDGEIISIDSMKVYRRMDIGTAKPPQAARREVRYHLIDVVEPSESFSVAEFLKQASAAMRDITGRGKKVIAVGGTALYIKALLYGLFEGPGSDESLRAQLRARVQAEGPEQLHRELMEVDPAASERISPNDAKRIIRAMEVFALTGKPITSFQRQWIEKPAHDWTIIGLRREKAEESKRINARVKRMIEAGLVDEVKGLLADGKPLSKQAACAIGYAEIIEYFQGHHSLDDAAEFIKKNTRHLAKSQRTWFKTFQNVNWIDVTEEETPGGIIDRVLSLMPDNPDHRGRG